MIQSPGGTVAQYPLEDPSDPSRFNFKKIVGAALMLIGALFILYGVSSGLRIWADVIMDNRGLVLMAGLVNFIFWSILLTPLVGLLANGVCIGGSLMVIGGLPTIPGALIASAGAWLYFKA